MNKKQLAAAAAGKLGLTRKEAENTVDVLLAAVTDALKRGETVHLVGFGTLERHTRAYHGSGADAETLHLAETVRFRAGKNLKAALSPKEK